MRHIFQTMRFAFYLCLLFAFVDLHAQDYLVTLRGDTLRGRAEIHSYPKIERVTLVVDKKKTEYPATAVQKVVRDSVTYVPVRTTDAYLFMRQARRGLVSLCYARQSPGTPYNVPFLVKRSGESIEVSALRFKRTISNFLSECNSIRTKIEEGQLGRNDLEKIIDEYNRCLESQTQQVFFESENPKLTALNAFNEKIGKDTSVPADARDILKDMYLRVKDGKPVPNYLSEGLKENLKGHPAYTADLESLLALLKN